MDKHKEQSSNCKGPARHFPGHKREQGDGSSSIIMHLLLGLPRLRKKEEPTFSVIHLPHVELGCAKLQGKDAVYQVVSRDFLDVVHPFLLVAHCHHLPVLQCVWRDFRSFWEKVSAYSVGVLQKQRFGQTFEDKLHIKDPFSVNLEIHQQHVRFGERTEPFPNCLICFFDEQLLN